LSTSIERWLRDQVVKAALRRNHADARARAFADRAHAETGGPTPELKRCVEAFRRNERKLAK
jgi:hypothetical protein